MDRSILKTIIISKIGQNRWSFINGLSCGLSLLIGVLIFKYLWIISTILFMNAVYLCYKGLESD